MPLSLRPHLLSKYLTQTFMSHGNEMICQHVTLSGYAEWPKVANAVIEASNHIQDFVLCGSRIDRHPHNPTRPCQAAGRAYGRTSPLPLAILFQRRTHCVLGEH